MSKINLLKILKDHYSLLSWIDKAYEIKEDRKAHEKHTTFKSFVALGQKIFNKLLSGSGVKVLVIIENEDERFNKVRQKVTRLV